MQTSQQRTEKLKSHTDEQHETAGPWGVKRKLSGTWEEGLELGGEEKQERQRQ